MDAEDVLPEEAIIEAIRALPLPGEIPLKLLTGLLLLDDEPSDMEGVRCGAWFKATTTLFPEVNVYLGAVWDKAREITQKINDAWAVDHWGSEVVVLTA